ncbi:MAG: ABC transporter permease [Bacteroidetes bacterium]|nr:MAG: ABC transporter permease [Bacteroidota bacterium]
MKTFLAFVSKEFKHIFRDKRTLIILFGMPIVLVVLFGFAITTEINNAKIQVVDLANDVYSTKLINKIKASGYFSVQENTKNINDIERIFQDGKVKLAVVIPQNFSKDLTNTNYAQIQIITDATDPNTSNIITSYLSAVFKQFEMEEGYTLSTNLEINTRMKYNPLNKSVYMFVPGVMTIILMLVSAMMTSITVAREKELGTMEILLVSPLKPSIIILGKIVPYLVLSLINAMTILLLGLFVFDMPMLGSYLVLFTEIFIFVLASLILGLLISTVSNSQQTAMLLSLMGLMLPTILLSGFIFPISSMPKILQYTSDIIPAKWFIIIIKSVMLKGVGITYIWKETLILIGIAIFLLVLTIKKFKVRLE